MPFECSASFYAVFHWCAPQSVCAGLGFVYIHPFKDGSERVQRYVIHHVLAACGFSPRGLIAPVSVAILDRMDDDRLVRLIHLSFWGSDGAWVSFEFLALLAKSSMLLTHAWTGRRSKNLRYGADFKGDTLDLRDPFR